MSKSNKPKDKEELRKEKDEIFNKFAKQLNHEWFGNIHPELWEDEIIKNRLHHKARDWQKQMKNGPILLTMIFLIEYGHLGQRETFRFMADYMKSLGYAGKTSAQGIWNDTNRDYPELIEHWRDHFEKMFKGTSAKTAWLESKRLTPEENEKKLQGLKQLFEENVLLKHFL